VTAALAERVYAPRGACVQAFKSRDPEVVVSGPAGTGKSRACLEKLHTMCLLNAGMKALICRKTAASLGSTALDTWRNHVAVEALERGIVSYYGGSAQEAPQYRYANGSRVWIGGMDKPSKIMSSEYDLIYVQEATELTVTDWEALTTRLRNGRVSFQQILADCNPDRPTHWLKQRAGAGVTTMLYSTHEDNPRLFDNDGAVTPEGTQYINRLDQLTGVRLQRLRYGRWVAAEGVVYDGFDPALNLTLKPHRPPDDWARYWSVDFGYTNPFVLQCWAVDPDGRAFMYREIYKTQTLVEDHARAILKAVTRQRDGSWLEPKPTAIICDHDAEDRATLERHLGMPTVAARKSVSDGIQAVQARWRPATDGRPRLHLVRDGLLERDSALRDAGLPCSTAEEVGGYVWNEAKDAPVKADDHGMDALRYFVAHLDLGPRVRLRWL
jgi:PBSX family phage terminase large subunit